MLPSAHNGIQGSLKIFIRLSIWTLENRERPSGCASTTARWECVPFLSLGTLIGRLKIWKIEVCDGDANQWVVVELQNKRKRNHCVLNGKLLE